MGTSKPNIVLFLADDQRFDTIAALGNTEIRTPNLDRLVERGTAFTHAHIPCGTSGAVCMPSRAMLNTGRTLFHIEGAGESIPESHTTIGECLRSAGYRTFGTGKWHNGRESFARSFSEGDEIFFGGMADHWNVPAYHFDPSGKYDSTINRCPDPMHSNSTEKIACDHINAGLHSSELIGGAAEKFILSCDSETPFYAYVSFLAPHDPRIMPEEFLEMYDPGQIELPLSFMGGHPFNNGSLHVRDEKLAAFPRCPDETRRHIAEYYAMITHLDSQVGRVFDAVENKGLLDDTIFVFAGDNGLALGRHGLFGKQNCYDHSVRVPLIFCGPGVPAGGKTESFAYLLDIFPTLCGLAGLETPASVEGKSLLPAMHDPKKNIRESLYFAFCGFQRAVRKGSFKLIEYVVADKRTKTQLFNLHDDPWELANLAEDAQHAETLCELRKDLLRLGHEWGDRESKWGREFWPAWD
ncbi:MAG: sulfatase-like hydrolase/transferase [Victivallales bacterium]|nr:sulfatase-like hydrolase/transferase [Victivallales bacterium]